MVPLRSRKPASVISVASCWLPTVGSPPSVQLRPSVCPVGGAGGATRVVSGRFVEPDERVWIGAGRGAGAGAGGAGQVEQRRPTLGRGGRRADRRGDRGGQRCRDCSSSVSRASSRVIAAPRVSRRSWIRRVISTNSAEGSAGVGSRVT